MPKVVLVPGFTQTGASWNGVRRVLRETCEVVTLEVPRAATFEETAHALGAEGGKAVYAGYSMGGRLVLRLALDHPELVDALVLVSATAGIADADERAERVAADEALAQSVERDGVDAFLARWLAQPMFASVPRDAPGLADRRLLTKSYLAHCLRVLGTGAMEPVWNRLGELAVPVAFVTGTTDAKFEKLALEMLQRVTDEVVHVRIEGGHALPLEQPAVLGGFIAAFAAEHG